MLKILIRTLFLLSVITLSLDAYNSVTKLKYEGGISLYGQVGVVNITLQEDRKKNIYKMTVTASATGLVKKLSSNRKDIYISEGVIKDGVYIPNISINHVIKDDFDEITTYIIDHEKNSVLKTKKLTKIEYGHKFDINRMGVVRTEELVTKEESKQIDFATNDFISLFLNSRAGNIKNEDVVYIDKKEKDSIRVINKDIFEIGKEFREDIYKIRFIDDESLFFKEAIAEDIAFYGNAYIKKIYEKSDAVNIK